MADNIFLIILTTAILSAVLTTAVLLVAFKRIIFPQLREQLDSTFDGIIGKARNQLRVELDDAIDNYLPRLRTEVGEGVMDAFKEGVPQHLAKVASSPADTLAKTSSTFINAGMDAFMGKKKK